MKSSSLVSFYHVVNEGSITAAARRMNVAKSTLSTQLQDLETDCGIRLLHRNTRNMVLTDAGQQLFVHAKAVVESIEAARASLDDFSQEISGEVRVTAPIDSSAVILPPLFAEFMKRYPQASVKLVSTNDVVDLVTDGMDVAFRTSVPADSSLIAREILRYRLKAVAAPELLGSSDPLSHPKALCQLPIVVHESLKKWSLTHARKGTTVTYLPKGQLVTNNVATIFELVSGGFGVGLLPDYRVDEMLKKGRLVDVLPGWQSEPISYFVAYVNRMASSRAVRAFIDFSRQYFD